MPDLKMLNSTKYLYKLTLVKCSYGVYNTNGKCVCNVAGSSVPNSSMTYIY